MIERIDTRIFEFIKRRASSILIYGGLAILISYTIVIEANGIPAYNNFAGWLWITLFIPVILGVYIYSHKIKEKKPGLRRFLRHIYVTWFVVYPILSIGLFIKWIALV